MKRSVLCMLFSATILLASCAAPPKQRIDRTYAALQELLPRFDPSVLKGRVIVIDPGHGGSFRGTRGPSDLDEASVNLGVALYLGGLLMESGATVHFTRSADKDFLSTADSSLSYDLEHRIAVVDSVHPDIFVSIHHNARSDRSPEINAIETYYKFGDPASRDLAFAVHRHLMRNLGIPDGEIKQGNYYVLRSVGIPAILGEASYLTNPRVEDKLQLSAKQKLEAEAYYLGILDYFRKGTPKIRLLAPAETTLAGVPDVVFAAEDIGGMGIDPDAVSLEVNGTPVQALFEREQGRIHHRLPWNAPNGVYDVSLCLRNLMGNSSPRIDARFKIDFPPERAVFESQPDVPPWGWGAVRIRIALLDGRGQNIAEGSLVRMSGDTDHLSRSILAREARIQDGYAEFLISPAANPESVAVSVECRGRTFAHTFKRLPVPPAAPSGVSTCLLALDRLTGAPVPGVSLECADSLIMSGSRSGMLCIPAWAVSDSMVARKRGYRPEGFRGGRDTLYLEPWFAGSLHGRKFVLDPQGGTAAAAGAGPLGLSASYVNAQVARYCASYLRLAGAEVLLTRSAEETVAPQDIVAMTNSLGADRYIEIRHHHSSRGDRVSDPEAMRTYFFPGSVLGKRMAESLAAAVPGYCGVAESSSGEQVTYPLQQTACPAVIVEFPSIETLAEELKLGEPWYLRQQAYALFMGILGNFSIALQRADLSVLIETDGDRANWLVTLDGEWNLMSSPSGQVTFGAVDAGSHIVSVGKRSTRLLQRIEILPGGTREITIPIAKSSP